ncbi:MAG: hypothetical protein HYU55_08245 [Nocardioides sp.]|nr:hypothetical protein [Nocardioides sp.]
MAPLTGLLTGLLAGLLALTTACEGDAPEPRPPLDSAAPLAELATDTMTVAREDFCARVAPAAVEEALRAAPADEHAWANGERAALAPGLTDVAHEYGCRWSADGTTVRAWVFAPPVTAGQAEDLRRAATRPEGCDPVAGAPRFGSRGVAVRCSGGAGGVTAFHGLFGDAWLSCSVETSGAEPAPPGEALDRASGWCATVLQAAAA